MTARRDLKGFTLVELLVVTGLMASLLGLLVAVGRPNVKSTVRRTAQDFAGSCLATQSQALGKPQGAGVVVVPNTVSSRMGTTVHDAGMQPLITGNVSGWPPADPRKPDVSVAVAADPCSIRDQAILSNAFKVRFQAASGDVISPWFSYSSGTASFRNATGQTLQNTIWPKGSSGLQAALAQYPSAGTLLLAMPKQVAIDLKYSGVGETQDASHGYGSFDGLGTIAISFDDVGRLSEVMRKVQEPRTSSDQPIVAAETVYLLFAARSDIEQNSSLSNDTSIWVAINPLSGRTTLATNVPQSATDAAALKAARAKAREGSALK